MFKLYGSKASPFVRHCRIALQQSDLAWELEEIDMAQSAEMSAAMRVPILRHGELQLSDSSSIVKYIREQSGASFCAHPLQFDSFCLANTVVDSALNTHFLAVSGMDIKENSYTQRQQQRVSAGLAELDARLSREPDFSCDATLRTLCAIQWGVFRDRMDISGLDNLQNLVAVASADPMIAASAPA